MNRLRKIRKDRDLHQNDIIKILNVSQVAYSYYEIGKRQLPIDLLITIINLLIIYFVLLMKENHKKKSITLNK